MAVDRGGLDYTITVADNFSVATKAFRKEIRASKAEFASFKREVRDLSEGTGSLSRNLRNVTRDQRENTTATRKAARESKQLAKISRDSITATDAQLAALKRQQTASGRAATALERLNAAQQRSIRTGVGFVRSTNAVNAAQERAGRGYRRTLPNLQAISEAQAQYSQSTDRLSRTLPRANKRLDQFAKTGKRAQGIFQTLLFSLRRLIGVFAAFAVARAVLGAFRQLVADGIRFNAQLQQAELGIAAVIAAAGSIRNAMGGATNAAQAFALAQTEARKQVQALRKDALATNATFEQLLDTFQVAIGPGLAAGLDVDEIRKLSIRISQAATAIGLPQNQLAEEIRSILSGTIQLRTTRLAAVLGITNEDIKNARELGELAQFLELRFEAFGKAGEESLENLNVLLINTQDGLRQVLAAGTEQGLFQETVALLKDLFGVLNELDDAGRSIGLRPEAVELARAFTSGLSKAVVVARQLVSNLSFGDILPIARTLSSVITLIARAGGVFIEGFVKGFGDALIIVNAIGSAIASVARFFGIFSGQNSVFRALLVTTLRVVVAFQTLRLTAFILFQTINGIVLATKFLQAQYLLINVTMAGILAKARALLIVSARFLLTPIGAAIAAIAVAVGVILVKTGTLQRIFAFFAGDVEAADNSAARMSERFETLAGQIRGGATEAERFEKAILRIEEELKRAEQQASFDLANVGVGGAVRRERQILAEAENKILNETKDISRQLIAAQENLLGVQKKRSDAAQELQSLSARTQTIVEAGVAVGGIQLNLLGRQAAVSKEIATLQLAAAAERQRGNDAEADALDARLASLGEEQRQLEASLLTARVRSDQVGDLLDQFSDVAELTEAQTEAIKEQIDERIRLQGEERTTIEQILDLQKQREAIEKILRESAIKRVRALAVGESLALAEQNQLLEVQVFNEQVLQNVRELGLGSRDLEFVKASAVLRLEERKLVILQQQQADQIAAAEATLEQVRGTEAEVAQAELLNQLLLQQANVRELSSLKVDELKDRLRELQVIAEQPVKAGFTVAFDDFAERSLDTFQNSLELMKSALGGFTTLVSSSIVDAFDPTKKVDLKERFARFLQGIAQQVLEQLTRIAITKAILNTGFGAGLAEGGSVAAGGNFVPSLAHYSRAAKGYSGGGVTGGGFTPPAGVSRKDTVPAWLQEKEFVHPVSSVMHYGEAFMEAVRRRAIPLASVQALMSSLSLHGSRVRASRGPGYQTGGSVTVQPPTQDSSLLQPTGSVGSGVAVIAPTEQAMERLNAGGLAASLRFFAEHRDSINSSLDSAGGQR